MNEGHTHFVTILATGNKAIIAVAKSILDSAGIQYIVKGEGVQDLFGLGRWGSGFSPITGPVEIQVRQDDKEEARQLLRDLVKNHSDDIA